MQKREKKRTKIAGKRTYNAKISNDTRKRSSTRAFQMQAMNMTIGKGNEQWTRNGCIHWNIVKCESESGIENPESRNENKNGRMCMRMGDGNDRKNATDYEEIKTRMWFREWGIWKQTLLSENVLRKFSFFHRILFYFWFYFDLFFAYIFFVVVVISMCLSLGWFCFVLFVHFCGPWDGCLHRNWVERVRKRDRLLACAFST